MSRVRLRTRVLAVLLGTLLPTMAHACAVCFSGSPRVRAAFLKMTVMMSLLPLGMLFGGAWALRRASGIKLAEELTETDNSLVRVVLEESEAPDAPVVLIAAPVPIVQFLPETAKRPGAFGPEAIEPS